MSRCPARARPRSGTRSPRAPRGGPRPRSTRRGRASPSAASTRAGYADHARGSAAPGHARRRPARPPRTAAPAASASPPYAHDTMRRETQLEGRTDALDLLAHFPAGVTPRPEQARLLAAVADAIAEALDDPAAARVVLVEGPPGVGKSHIAMTLARWSGDAYLLTSQKLLQDQYEREFGAELQIVKGRDNYACDRYPGAHVPTSRGACRRPRGPLCQCPYVRAKTAALGAPIFCANTTYFATLRHRHAQHLRKRRLLIIDEAHNLESQLVSVFTVAFAREQMQAWFGAALPRLPSADEYRPLLVEHLERLEGRRAAIGRELEALRPPEIAADDFLRMPPSRAEQELLAQRDELEGALARLRYFVD